MLQSTWTSHRAYLGVASAPAWLDVATGLMLSGFEPTEAGRAAFEAFLAARSNAFGACAASGPALRSRLCARAPRGDQSAHRDRALALRAAGPPTYAAAGRWSRGRGGPVRHGGRVDGLGARVAIFHDASARGGRGAAGCLAGMWAFLGQPRTEMAAALGLSGGAATHLLRWHPERLAQAQPMARRVAAACRGTGAPKVKEKNASPSRP